MDPSNVALLLILGSAENEPTPLEDIAALVPLLAPYDQSLSSDLLSKTAEAAIREHLLIGIAAEGQGSSLLKSTPAGRARLEVLLRQPVPSHDLALMRTVMSVKVCFLHHLRLPDRVWVAEELSRHYREAIALIARLQRRPRSRSASTSMAMRHDLLTLHSELGWIEGVMRWHAVSQAAE